MVKDKVSKDEFFLRRQALKELCTGLKAAKDMGAYPECETMNELLKAFYAEAGHTELHTFKQWKEKGFYVKKGEKAILLWATPKASKSSKLAAVDAGKQEDEAKEDYFPIAYLFSNKQVAKQK